MTDSGYTVQAIHCRHTPGPCQAVRQLRGFRGCPGLNLGLLEGAWPWASHPTDSKWLGGCFQRSRARTDRHTTTVPTCAACRRQLGRAVLLPLLLLLLLLLAHPLACSATEQPSTHAETVAGKRARAAAVGGSSVAPFERPLVIAHRGASGPLPEHTIIGYQSAIDSGADFIECDVVLTADLHPVCRHEPNINATTDAWELFPHKAATYEIDGEQVTGIFAFDLTLAELHAVRARQRLAFRGSAHDGAHAVPTLEEFLRVAVSAPRVVGIYPEIKNPTFHNALPQAVRANATIEGIVLAALQRHGYDGALGSAAWRRRPAFIQCFEVGALRALARATRLPLVLLLGGWPGWVAPDTRETHEEATSDASLAQLGTILAGVGAWKGSLYTSPSAASPPPPHGGGGGGGGGEDAAAAAGHEDLLADLGSGGGGGGGGGGTIASTGLAARLHAHGLQVHAYTLRDEPQFVPAAFQGRVAAEIEHLVRVERVDGVFADWPATLRAWLETNVGHRGGSSDRRELPRGEL